MIEITHAQVFNFEAALRGARNPMNSWAKSDSELADGTFDMGENDLDLAGRLCAAGSDHRKFLRQIFVSFDVNAPMYWWKEFDTYKVGVTANSTSTMHKIHSRPFDLSDFSFDQMNDSGLEALKQLLKVLEQQRLLFCETSDKKYWYTIIQLLPSSYNQLRTLSMSYENLVNMYHARKSHKLGEWREYCKFVETLPYAKQLIVDAKH